MGSGREVEHLYWTNEQKCRKYTKNMFCYYSLFNESATLVSLCSSVFMVFTGNFDTSKLILPFTFAVPFDTETMWGWYLLWFIQLNVGVSYGKTMISITSYFICCCFYIETICDHFNLVIESIEQPIDGSGKGRYQMEHLELVRIVERNPQEFM